MDEKDKEILYRVDERVNGLIVTINGYMERMDKRAESHDTRLSDLEKIQNQFIGKQGLIGGLIGTIFSGAIGLITMFHK